MPKTAQTNSPIKLPPATDWRTTDTDEINKRRQRAREGSFVITNTAPTHPVFSNFRVKSGSGQAYLVEVRDIATRQFACDCVDFRINGLGTCKHVEAVLLELPKRNKGLYEAACRSGSRRIEVVVDGANTLRVLNGREPLPPSVAKWFDAHGRLANGSPERALESLRQLRETDAPDLRISQEIEPWLENRRRVLERRQLRREYELKVQRGEWPDHETTVPLFPYQREGMLHLAFAERALLADEMGLGKTIQAIAACALLHRLGKARRALVVTPASLKAEWEEQIRRFTRLDHHVVFGGKARRLQAYEASGATPFFTIVNYEQIVADALEVNARLAPDVVVLDEAQRIKNWSTRTAQTVKLLRSRYAFVLTGTPIENRIDELHSLIDFLNPVLLGPLFRFNREFYELDERGRPTGYRNLDVLHERIKPVLLRRRKADVETELPERTDRNHFVALSECQRSNYTTHQQHVLKLVNAAQRRPLTHQEQQRLQRELAMMRMTCDTNYILDPEDETCPKLVELEKLLDECHDNDAKVIIFSEWERMLELVRDLCQRRSIGFAWHTGSVPQRQRRAEINMFKNDPACRVFLSTDCGATGLNLQNASVVINCDLPWNPARLEQRIARAWRKHQTRAVTVVNLISEGTIEHRMLDTLAIKQSVAASVLDRPGEVKEIKLRSGRQAFVDRLQQLVTTAAEPSHRRTQSFGPANSTGKGAAQIAASSADPALAFARLAAERINGALVRCEERFAQTGPGSVIVAVVEKDAAQWREKLNLLHTELFGAAKTDSPAPVRLEVIDRLTQETIQRLINSGVLAENARASRMLFQAGGNPALSQEEQIKARAHRDRAARKLKVAQVLASSDFADEARQPLLDAIHAIGCALAIESHMPEPVELKDALQPPLSRRWTDALPTLSAFAEDASADWRPVAQRLATI